MAEPEPSGDEKKKKSSVRVHFLLPKGKSRDTCSDDLEEAFEQCDQNHLNPFWITEDKAFTLKPEKTDVFVVDPFDGAAYEYLTQYKCTIVGPRCILTCLHIGESVPELPYPMFTASMRRLIITSTNFTKERKTEIQKTVELMGGIYSNSFHDGVTHLVANGVKSRKYEVAMSKDVPVMTGEWVDKVWEKSKHENVHATDAPFSRYRCPALLGLNITVSQLSKKDRDLIKKSIESHGGIYSGSLDMETTTLLILTKPEGDKYKYALKWRIPCVTSDWVFDSIEKAQCLGTEPYRVDNLNTREKVSTPEKNDITVARLQDVSMCSIILHPNDQTTTTKEVNETAVSVNSTTNINGVDRGPREELLYDIQRVKKAGNFLEDIRIFLSGFHENEFEKIRLAIQTAGGVSLSQLTSSVTHMVIKKQVPHHFKILRELDLKPYKVTIEWIVQSMFQNQPVLEEEFAYCEEIIEEPEQTTEEQDTQFEDDLMAQYKDSGPPPPEEPEPEQPQEQDGGEEEKNNLDGEDEESTVLRFLTGKKLYLTGVESEKEIELVDWIGEAGGEVVSIEHKGSIDYLVTGLTYDPTKHISMEPENIWTHLWLEDCLDQGKIAPTQFFHLPITLEPDFKPCKDVVIGITNYAGFERQYIHVLAESLGMLSQEMFAKRDKKGAKRSTHLVCKLPEGNKYEAGLKWELPVVSHEWLLSCLKHKTFVSEKTFLVGNSTVVTPDKPDVEELEKAFEAVENSEKEKIETQGLSATELNQIVQENDDDDEDDDEIIIKKPSGKLKTPTQQNRRMTIETPEVDMEKFKPIKYDLNTSMEVNTASKWAAGSEPLGAGTQGFTQSTGKRKRDSQDNPYLQGVSTPDTPYGAFLHGPNPNTQTRKYYKKHCENMGKFELPEEEIQAKKAKLDNENNQNLDQSGNGSNVVPAEAENQAEDSPKIQPVNENLREQWKDNLQAKGVIVLDRDKRRFSDIMEDKAQKLGKSWRNPSRKITLVNRDKKALKDVVVYVAKKLDHLQEKLTEMVCNLGGQFMVQYNPVKVTHVVFVGRQYDLNREFKTARDHKKFIVHPDWVKMCHQEQKRIEESLFHHFYNPKKSLNISSMASTSKLNTSVSGGSTSTPSNSKENFVKSNSNSNVDLGNNHNKKHDNNHPELNAHLQNLDNLIGHDDFEEDMDGANEKDKKMRLSSMGGGKDPNGRGGRKKKKEESQVLWHDKDEETERSRLSRELETPKLF